MRTQRPSGSSGQILIGVILVMMALLIMVPALVQWVQQESKASVKDKKSATAFNLAQAAVERGMWKLKSSTSTWATAVAGTVITGYDFDTTYKDVPGGTYRIRFEDGLLNGAAVVTVRGEGRDEANKETRAISAVYQNISIPGAIIAGGNLQQAGTSVVQWGPVMAMGPITLSGSALTEGYPRKLSKQYVSPFDTSVNPPNTDNLEWWSDYDVPELPVFDFAAMKSSAIATNTYNCGGVWNAAVLNQVLCNTGCTACNVAGLYLDSRRANDYIWYWDQDVVINGAGTKGTTIVRGNLTLKGGDYGNVESNMRIPYGAWREYQKIDNAATNTYPGDNGYQAVKNEYELGSCGSTCEGGATGDDLGFSGFVYVGSDITMTSGSAADIYGAVWVVGDWISLSNNIIFFNDQLSVPTLNVVLVRQSWQETAPNTTAWAP
ncbi:MAG: hypothetical protein M0D55_01230 [Elusimicrobiota bacterium]|nr:MAG: hypothetical protein M0D55_01230 [Elusimicrobiota bacterium]